MKGVLKSCNPADGSLIGQVDVTDINDINAIVEKSRKAQQQWAALTIDERMSVLERAGQALAMEARAIAMLLSMEMGKGIRRAVGEVSGCAGSIPYVASRVKDAIKPQVNEGYGSRTTVKYDPVGVCGIISPWNYPVSMAHWMIIPALTAGNSVVLKPSEETPLVAGAYVEALNKVLPEGLLQIVYGDEEQGKALVKSGVNFVGFTGSMEAGKDIMKAAAGSLKPIMMELGGKDPMIVLEDADIDDAVSFAVANSLENSGQMCISTERIFVDEKILNDFEKAAVHCVQYYKVGPYNDPQADIGPIINETQRRRILEHIEDAVSKGARILIGGRGDDHPPRYILPTVLTGVTDEMLVAREETFGPLICITGFEDSEQAVKSANSTDYGLGAVVYGYRDAERIASQLDAGMIGINTGAGGGGDTPWVGAKMSGYGYHGSPDGHRQFTQPRVVSEVLNEEY